MAESDLSRIVNLIMENPKLIDEIKSIAESDRKDKNEVTESIAPQSADTDTKVMEETVIADGTRDRKKRRNELLCALKPYVSEERSRAIDTMISIADILDITRER